VLFEHKRRDESRRGTLKRAPRRAPSFYSVS